jgi:hypothetical protein
MPASGQKAKYSLRAHVFRFTPESGLKSDIARCLKRADIIAKVFLRGGTQIL